MIRKACTAEVVISAGARAVAPQEIAPLDSSVCKPWALLANASEAGSEPGPPTETLACRGVAGPGHSAGYSLRRYSPVIRRDAT